MKKSITFFVCLTIFVLVLFFVYDYQTKKLQTVISNTQIELNFIQKFERSKNSSLGLEKSSISPRNKKIKRKHHVPKFMLELYEKSKSITYEEYIKTKRPVADVVKSVIPKNAGSVYERKIHSGQTLEKSHLLIFDVPFPNKDEIFLTAELRILTLVELEPNTLSGIERVIELSLYDDITKKIINLDQKHIYHTNNTWMSFNMTSVIKKAVTRNTATLTLIVTLQSYLSVLKDNKGKLEISVLPISEEYYLEHDYPVLLLSYSSSKLSKYHSRIYKNLKVDVKMFPYFNRSKTKRFKRNIDEVAEDFEEETNNVWDDDKLISRSNTKKNRRVRNSCRKKTLYVDFAEINYDSWIVQPSGYEAYQCAGKCFYPVAEHLSPTKHAIVQALMHSVSPHKAVRSCCVPTKLTSISVLYIDSKGVLTYRLGYQDMVVSECGCR